MLADGELMLGKEPGLGGACRGPVITWPLLGDRAINPGR